MFLPLLILFAAFAYGQTPPLETFEIRGKIEEFGLGQALAGVEVTVDRYEGKALSSLTPKTRAGTATTGTDGAFRFTFETPGTYRVNVQKAGLLPPGSPMDGFLPSAQFDLDAANPRKEVKFQLARPAEISGTIVDEETGKPVPGLPVVAVQFGYSAGSPMLMPSGANSAITGPDGRFVFTNLSPTNYVVVVGTRLRVSADLKNNPALANHGAEPRILTEFADRDREAVDLDYDISYWPGGAGFQNISPVPLVSAAKLDLGQLSIRKITKYRVLLSMAGSDCTGIKSVLLPIRSAAHPNAPFTPSLGTVPCGATVLLRGFTPGEYDLEVVASNSENGKPQLTASIRFQVGRGPETVPISLAPGATITGLALAAEGAKMKDFDGMRILLQPTAYGAIRHGLIPIDAAGRFKIDNVGMREYRLRVSGIPETHYLQEVRFNGIPARDRVFTLNSAATANAVELVFDDKPAAVTGSVKLAGKPVPEAQIYLVPTPAPEGREFFSAVRFATAGTTGNFTIAGIPPGEYRIFALPSELKNTLHRPGESERLLKDAQRITLTRSQTRISSLAPAK